jgi:raffinose/stachyose/melibiose transport system permease protein
MADTAISLPAGSQVARAPAHGHRRGGSARWVVLAILLLLLLIVLFPFFLAIANAFKSGADYALNGPLALPHSLSLTALTAFWNTTDFSRKLFNSLLISIVVSAGAVLISLLNAYAIGIGRVRGGKWILLILLMGIMVPQESIVYPLYYMVKASGLYDTMLAVMIIFAVLHSAFGTYLLSAVLTAFPREILEAAQIDGANRWQVLWLVVVPVLRPTLMVLATFFFIWTWNEFLIPLVMLVSNNNQTVSVAMGLLQGQNTSDPTLIAAAALLGIAPTIVFFAIFQRTLTRGVVVGSIK